MRFVTLLAAPLAVLAVTATPALADGGISTRTVRVGDLDLASPAGKGALSIRIGRAVEALCGSYATTAEPSTQDAITACRSEARSSIDRQLAARAAAVQLAAR